MMKKLELSPRLMAIAEWVSTGARVADIGTDHGYLPVWLLQNGKVERALATDLRQAPLEKAKASAERYGVNGRMEFILCDGLSALGPEAADTVVIAGMGGETIAAILGAAPWTKAAGHALLLQPMSKIAELRGWLAENGYAIARERLVGEQNTIYTILLVRGGSMPPMTPAQTYAGPRLLAARDPLLGDYLDELIGQTGRVLEGLGGSDRAENIDRASYFRKVMEGLTEMKEEWTKCQK